MNYIFVKLMGGLGNQLFQYAAALLQRKHTSGTIVLAKAENPHDSYDYRSLFSEGLIYNAGIPNVPSIYQEDGFGVWNPEDYKFPMLLLYGYFQNYKVLKPILQTLKESLCLQFTRFEIVPNSGFIHVRRGDYLNLPNVHHVQPLEYYEKALSILNNISHWYVFSDDLEWCKQQSLFKSLNTTFVDKNTLESLSMMSQIHDGAIIANSSFSWWGAYLGVGETNRVIYPKRWFESKTPDLFPDEWVGI